MPSETFVHSAVAAAVPAAILGALERAETWRGIGPIDEVWDETHAGDGTLTGFRWSARAAGKSWEGTAARAASKESTLAFDLDASEITGTITVSVVAENDSHSTISVQLAAQSRGVLAGMFWGVVADALRSGLARQVEEFARQF